MGLAFEDACRTWLGGYATGPEADGITEIGSWWHRTGSREIDVVTLRRYSAEPRFVSRFIAEARRLGPLGSCKWDPAASPQALGKLRRDREALAGPDAEGELLVFARGFSDDLVQRSAREGARLVAVDELYD